MDYEYEYNELKKKIYLYESRIQDLKDENEILDKKINELTEKYEEILNGPS